MPLRTDLDRDFPEVHHVWCVADDWRNGPVFCTIGVLVMEVDKVADMKIPICLK